MKQCRNNSNMVSIENFIDYLDIRTMLTARLVCRSWCRAIRGTRNLYDAVLADDALSFISSMCLAASNQIRFLIWKLAKKHESKKIEQHLRHNKSHPHCRRYWHGLDGVIKSTRPADERRYVAKYFPVMLTVWNGDLSYWPDFRLFKFADQTRYADTSTFIIGDITILKWSQYCDYIAAMRKSGKYKLPFTPDPEVRKLLDHNNRASMHYISYDSVHWIADNPKCTKRQVLFLYSLRQDCYIPQSFIEELKKDPDKLSVYLNYCLSLKLDNRIVDRKNIVPI